MKAITVRLSDDEYEKLRFEAYEARESIGRRAALFLGMALGKLSKSEVKQRISSVPVHAVDAALGQKRTEEVKQESTESVQKKGVDVTLKEAPDPNTVEGARERVAEMEAKKKARDAAELKRIQEAGKSMEKRYGVK